MRARFKKYNFRGLTDKGHQRHLKGGGLGTNCIRCAFHCRKPRGPVPCKPKKPRGPCTHALGPLRWQEGYLSRFRQSRYHGQKTSRQARLRAPRTLPPRGTGGGTGKYHLAQPRQVLLASSVFPHLAGGAGNGGSEQAAGGRGGKQRVEGDVMAGTQVTIARNRLNFHRVRVRRSQVNILSS